MKNIDCEHPVFIVNPCIGELAAKYGTFYLFGVPGYYKKSRKWFYHFDKRPFTEKLDLVTKDNYETSYFIDTSTGETYPIYLCVPCGNCLLCKQKKVNSLVQRIKYESFCYSDKPLFLTLTYNDKWLPNFGVSLRDIQLFFKRFRINLIRAGYKRKIRYIVVSEYGKRHRAHYHAIIFGLPTSDDVSLRRMEKLLNKSWSRGFIMARAVDMRNDKCAYYTSKYLIKECTVPNGCFKCFCTSSRRGGGLGASFFSRQAKELRSRVSCKPRVLNPWTGLQEDLKWSKYALDKIYPSRKKYIPLELRKALKKYVLAYAIWKHYNPELLWLFDTNYSKIRNKFENIDFIPWDLEFKHIPVKYLDRAGDIYESERIIFKYIDNDYSDSVKIEKQRIFLLSNLNFNSVDDICLAQKLCKIKRDVSRSKSLEIL